MKTLRLVPILLLLGACSQGAELEHYQKLWAQQAPASYSYVYGLRGMLGTCRYSIGVETGTVESASAAPGYEADCFRPFSGKTVEQLFLDVRRALDGSCRVSVTYDEGLGYPLGLYEDCGEDGAGWSVSEFTSSTQ